MRILVVARWAPWPARSGAQLRSANMITALASLGEVDVFLHVDPRHETELHVPPGLAVHAVGGATRSDRPPSRVDRAVTLVSGTTPSRIVLPALGLRPSGTSTSTRSGVRSAPWGRPATTSRGSCASSRGWRSATSSTRPPSSTTTISVTGPSGPGSRTAGPRHPGATRRLGAR